MSTATQVNATYYWYVCTYIYNSNNDPTMLNGCCSMFKLDNNSDGKGASIVSWSVPGIAQPTLDNLMAITPSQIALAKQYYEMYRFMQDYPKLLSIFRNIYNRLSVAINIPTNQYPNDVAMANYLRTLF